LGAFTKVAARKKKKIGTSTDTKSKGRGLKEEGTHNFITTDTTSANFPVKILALNPLPPNAL
jgi:hypothetical protein